MDLNRNLLIEAGAGTGKTTRLVKAVIQALFIREIPLNEMVALTFTNKAASELKERVNLALMDVLDAKNLATLKEKPWWPDPEPTQSLDDLQKLAREAMTVMDRADISTIHSFAYSLLKRFPLQAGIDPGSEIDDKGLVFDALFRREWPTWLSVELGDTAPREAEWLDLLSKLTLSEIEKAARELADFQVPIEKLSLPDNDLPRKLGRFHQGARQLAAEHTGDLNADRLARACEEIIGSGAKSDWKKLESHPAETQEALSLKPGSPKAWSETEIQRLKVLQSVSKNILARGDRTVALLTDLLKPFVISFRETLLSEGCLTHSALLYLSRDIVKNHTQVRTALKHEIRLILIDEFQDTDPLQAELLLYLAEKQEPHAKDWEVIQLGAGKLFIVGDPKQSIYRFRGADIAAYERIGKLLVAQGGLQETLEVNYRSQAQIIHVVNAAFTRIIQPVTDVSPPYIPVQPRPDQDSPRPVQDVQIWLADSSEKQTAEQAQATEAEHIARWIKESQGQLNIYDPKEGKLRPFLYSDVALIFRTYSPMDRFIDALRRHDIPYAVESERYFFTTPEVTDFINLLRAADDPEDILSLVGYLRSPMGGLTDEDILRRKNAGALEELEPVRWLRTVTRRLGREPLTEVLQHIFDDTYLMELAVRSYHGDQTLANLMKLRRLLEEFSSEGVTTMGLLLEKLEEFFADDKIEGENPLADENYNAIRLLTIHKAKGLEYPIVFLPSLHSELRAHQSEPFIYDWRSQTLGLKVKDTSNLDLCNLDKIELDEQTRVREAAEENRILYVAMTRARERLVVSGGVNLISNRSRTYLQRLMEAWDQTLGDVQEGEIKLDDASITVKRLERVSVQEKELTEGRNNPLKNVDPEYFAKVWKEREEAKKKAEKTDVLRTPTAQRDTWYEREEPDSSRTTYHVPHPRPLPTTPLLLGTLVHRFLETWDFSCEKCSMPAKLRVVANAYFASQGLLKEPFQDPKDGDKTNNPTELIEVVEDAQRLLADFIGSEAWVEIKGSTILGREVPFFYQLPKGALMRGTMDILYRSPDGKLVVGDYKTDNELYPGKYASQAQAYAEAAQRALGEKAQFKLISLREGSTFTAEGRRS